MSDLELELNTPDEEMVPTIMLMDEDGTEEAHQVLAWQELYGREFAVLCPVDIQDGEEVGLVIMESRDGSLEFVADEAITQEVFDAFIAAMGADDEEDAQ